MKHVYAIILFLLVGLCNAQDLKKDTIELNETIFYDKSKFKLKRVGHDTKTKSILIGLTADINFKKDSLPEFIKELIIPIKTTNKEYTFQRLNFNFSDQIKDDSILLKVDLYASKKGELDKSLLNEPMQAVVKKSKQHENIFTIDLRDLNLKHRGDFFISMELLSKIEKPVYFSAALLGKCLYKSTRSSQIKKTPLGITPAINADILIRK